MNTHEQLYQRPEARTPLSEAGSLYTASDLSIRRQIWLADIQQGILFFAFGNALNFISFGYAAQVGLNAFFNFPIFLCIFLFLIIFIVICLNNHFLRMIRRIRGKESLLTARMVVMCIMESQRITLG